MKSVEFEANSSSHGNELNEDDINKCILNKLNLIFNNNIKSISQDDDKLIEHELNRKEKTNEISEINTVNNDTTVTNAIDKQNKFIKKNSLNAVDQNNNAYNEEINNSNSLDSNNNNNTNSDVTSTNTIGKQNIAIKKSSLNTTDSNDNASSEGINNLNILESNNNNACCNIDKNATTISNTNGNSTNASGSSKHTIDKNNPNIVDINDTHVDDQNSFINSIERDCSTIAIINNGNNTDNTIRDANNIDNINSDLNTRSISILNQLKRENLSENVSVISIGDLYKLSCDACLSIESIMKKKNLGELLAGENNCNNNINKKNERWKRYIKCIEPFLDVHTIINLSQTCKFLYKRKYKVWNNRLIFNSYLGYNPKVLYTYVFPTIYRHIHRSVRRRLCLDFTLCTLIKDITVTNILNQIYNFDSLNTKHLFIYNLQEIYFDYCHNLTDKTLEVLAQTRLPSLKTLSIKCVRNKYLTCAPLTVMLKKQNWPIFTNFICSFSNSWLEPIFIISNFIVNRANNQNHLIYHKLKNLRKTLENMKNFDSTHNNVNTSLGTSIDESNKKIINENNKYNFMSLQSCVDASSLYKLNINDYSSTTNNHHTNNNKKFKSALNSETEFSISQSETNNNFSLFNNFLYNTMRHFGYSSRLSNNFNYKDYNNTYPQKNSIVNRKDDTNNSHSSNGSVSNNNSNVNNSMSNFTGVTSKKNMNISINIDTSNINANEQGPNKQNNIDNLHPAGHSVSTGKFHISLSNNGNIGCDGNASSLISKSEPNVNAGNTICEMKGQINDGSGEKDANNYSNNSTAEEIENMIPNSDNKGNDSFSWACKMRNTDGVLTESENKRSKRKSRDKESFENDGEEKKVPKIRDEEKNNEKSNFEEYTEDSLLQDGNDTKDNMKNKNMVKKDLIEEKKSRNSFNNKKNKLLTAENIFCMNILHNNVNTFDEEEEDDDDDEENNLNKCKCNGNSCIYTPDEINFKCDCDDCPFANGYKNLISVDDPYIQSHFVHPNLDILGSWGSKCFLESIGLDIYVKGYSVALKNENVKICVKLSKKIQDELYELSKSEKYKNNNLVYLLRDKGSELLSNTPLTIETDENGGIDIWTLPISLAISKKNRYLFYLVLKGGAKVDIWDYLGKSPLYIACENECKEFVEVLIDERRNRKKKNNIMQCYSKGLYNIDREDSIANCHGKNICVDDLNKKMSYSNEDIKKMSITELGKVADSETVNNGNNINSNTVIANHINDNNNINGNNNVINNGEDFKRIDTSNPFKNEPRYETRNDVSSLWGIHHNSNGRNNGNSNTSRSNIEKRLSEKINETQKDNNINEKESSNKELVPNNVNIDINNSYEINNSYDFDAPNFEGIKKNDNFNNLCISPYGNKCDNYYVTYPIDIENGYIPLNIAIKKKNFSIVNSLVESGERLDIKCPYVRDYKSPLYLACENNISEIIQLLLEKKANPNWCYHNKFTPILLAYNLNKAWVNHFLDAGAGEKACDRHILTELISCAIFKKDLSTVQLLLKKYPQLLQKGHKLWSLPFIQAAKLERLNILKYLYSLKKEIINQLDANNVLSPIHAAAEEGNVEIIKFLIENDVNINLTNKYHQNALHIACLENQEKVAQLLIANNVDVNCKDNINGECPLMICIRTRNENLAMLILNESKNINYNLTNIHGETSLIYSIFYGLYDVADILMARGADASVRDINGDKSYNVACERVLSNRACKNVLKKFLKLYRSQNKNFLPQKNKINKKNKFYQSYQTINQSFFSIFRIKKEQKDKKSISYSIDNESIQ
ncbi:erythrocyte membrane protein [Plasmodium yoelii]|uniref:Ankyrin-repeat protein n=3 Tax=Plasmodium yoelii TaxID=5861 RepID=A0AAF0B1B1_PLAYO|nr:erythrocyte membrane protein [Plasmodium yoelii]EAA16533.1 ERYTHROCYTE MEMBRANE PROTEIN PFEMP3 [Plasmodium yoelii yoelii]WBY58677.1 ankyrin-repeat protein [Plasmodium yoelii yoelii]CDU18961.1 conserved Plasmodium protein, unknown function [Plasmodium yoelii]VTZ79546.1 ankyrin-repeat protein, putative [Plasmodium yoelii]|eukprot:XP_724968.1 erythrocyte membrane protein [Plasmodium yoelii]